jgi:hypothetical protein
LTSNQEAARASLNAAFKVPAGATAGNFGTKAAAGTAAQPGKQQLKAAKQNEQQPGIATISQQLYEAGTTTTSSTGKASSPSSPSHLPASKSAAASPRAVNSPQAGIKQSTSATSSPRSAAAAPPTNKPPWSTSSKTNSSSKQKLAQACSNPGHGSGRTAAGRRTSPNHKSSSQGPPKAAAADSKRPDTDEAAAAAVPATAAEAGSQVVSKLGAGAAVAPLSVSVECCEAPGEATEQQNVFAATVGILQALVFTDADKLQTHLP